MRIRTKAVMVGFLLAVCMWVVDAALDSWFHYEASFVDLLIVDVPPHELYIRSAIAIILVAATVIIGHMSAEMGEQVDRIQHLNSVLRATRDINQLIATEDNPRQLLSRTCTTLTATRGYTTAWIALTDGDDLPVLYANGLGDLRDALASHLTENGPLPCMRRAADAVLS